jgi:hypothetical protein
MRERMLDLRDGLEVTNEFKRERRDWGGKEAGVNVC